MNTSSFYCSNTGPSTAHGDSWDWEVPLEERLKKVGRPGRPVPSVTWNLKAKFGHNVVRKVRWAFNQRRPLRDNRIIPGFEKRKQSGSRHAPAIPRNLQTPISSIIDGQHKTRNSQGTGGQSWWTSFMKTAC